MGCSIKHPESMSISHVLCGTNEAGAVANFYARRKIVRILLHRIDNRNMNTLPTRTYSTRVYRFTMGCKYEF